MDKDTKFLVAGGDLRQIYLAKYLSDKYQAVTVALGEDSLPVADVSGADVLVLPIVVTNDGIHLNAPFSDTPISLASLTGCLKAGAVVAGGMIPDDAAELFRARGFRTVDYFKREELIVKNCIPTAEGALQIAMEELPVTICGLKTLVIGYGRVGKVTAKLFSAAGADVSASARKFSDLAWCSADRIKPITTQDAIGDLSRFDLIINTVPSIILDKTRLSKVSKDALIIDLASKPGGVDFEAAGELGLKVIWALSLPAEAKKAKPQFPEGMLRS